MSTAERHLPSGFALVLAGSLSAKPQDRTLARDGIRPVQVITSDGVRAAPGFSGVGELGVSALAFLDGGERLFFSTGADLLEVDLGAGSVHRHVVGGLADVHEITVADGRLLIANTGADEVVIFSVEARRVLDRHSLASFRSVSSTEASQNEAEARSAVDRFHLNQAVVDHGGDMLVLVHHVNGKQTLKYVAEKVIKLHGDGGVLNLDRGAGHPLRLSAPHSIQAVGEEFWVCNSGRGELQRFSRYWEFLGTISTRGWGRGTALTPHGETLFVGMSPIRKRYLPFMASRSVARPSVEAFDVTIQRSVGVTEVGDIEQINNLYLLPRDQAERLLSCSPSSR